MMKIQWIPLWCGITGGWEILSIFGWGFFLEEWGSGLIPFSSDF
jgi:hypothetical protein